MISNRYDFKGKYSSLKNEYKDLIPLSESVVDKIQTQIDNENLKHKTNKYIISVVGASLSIILFPFVIRKIYNSLIIIAPTLVKIIEAIPKEIVEILNFSFIIGGFSILFYLFLIPSFSLFGKKFPAKPPFELINKKQTNYIITAIIGVYIVIGFIALLLFIDIHSLKPLVVPFLKYYIFIPIALFSFFLFMFLIVLVFILPFSKYFTKEFEYSSNTRIEISFLLFNVLEILKKNDNCELFSQKDLVSITDNLMKVGVLIENYPNEIADYFSDKRIINDFKKASNEIENFTAAFIENQETYINESKDRIIKYLNIFLKGNISELPKSEAISPIEKTKKIKFYHYFFLLFYLTLPILVIILLKLVFNIALDEYTQSLLKILYLVWAFVGIFTNPIIFSSENKEMMKDIIKTLVGKG